MNRSQVTGTEFLLSPWQKVQAAMLYHYASLDYLRALHAMVTDLIDGRIEPLLQHAKSEGRDTYLVDAQRGTRDTSANWANHAWPFFKQLQASLAKDIADRALERYGFTDVFNCFRGAGEFSLRWTTPAWAISDVAFVERPCSWFFVEIRNDEFEPIEFGQIAQQDLVTREHVAGGGVCREAGYYFTPAIRESRRYFAVGDVMPDYQSEYGETFWQWDWVQS